MPPTLTFLIIMDQFLNSKEYNDSKSAYMRSILAPYLGPAPIPDDNMVPCFPKSTSLTDNWASIGSGQNLYVYVPHRTRGILLHYIYLPPPTVPSGYYYYRTIPLDQDLSTDFTFGRFVSGGITIISSTVASGQFEVAGIMTAVSVAEFPELMGLVFGQLTSYKRNAQDVISAQLVAKGVVVLASPDATREFRVFETTESVRNGDQVRFIDNYEDNSLAVTGWNHNTSLNQNSFTLYDTGAYPNRVGILPPNACGKIIIDYNAYIRTGGVPLIPNGITVQFSIVAWQTNDGVSRSSRSVNKQVLVPSVNISGGFAYMQAVHTIEWDSDCPIDQVLITIASANAQNWVNLNVESGTVGYTFVDFYGDQLKNGYLIGTSGVPIGQAIAISGVDNHEVVPNSSLSKNITTSYYGPYNPYELMLVSNYLADRAKNGIRFVWDVTDYKYFIGQNGQEKHTDLTKMATASGFGDFLRGVLGGMRPLLGTALPAIGHMVAGPMGGQMGTLANSMLFEEPRSIATASSFRRGPIS